jgi:hypothetical protein
MSIDNFHRAYTIRLLLQDLAPLGRRQARYGFTTDVEIQTGAAVQNCRIRDELNTKNERVAGMARLVYERGILHVFHYNV